MGKKIVAYAGDYYHPAAPIRVALEQALGKGLASAEIELAFAENAAAFIAMLEDKPDAAVLFAENRVDPEGEHGYLWLTKEYEAAIVRYVKAGGGWLAWHCALASYDPGGDYVGMLRGHFLSHPPDHAMVRYDYVSGAEAGQSFELLDEHYFVQCDEVNTEVYLRSTSVDGESVAGWRHTFGHGRVCCLTPAHREDGLLHSAVQQAIREAAAWTWGLPQ
jgi:hypothetical protein